MVPFNNLPVKFLKRKLSPIGDQKNKILQLWNYKAYAEHANIAPEKSQLLDSINFSNRTKLEVILNSPQLSVDLSAKTFQSVQLRPNYLNSQTFQSSTNQSLESIR